MMANSNITVIISSEIFPHVMSNHIAKIPKPKEVLVMVDESGNVIQESYKDTESINLYEIMKKTLMIFALIDSANMTKIMLDSLAQIVF